MDMKLTICECGNRIWTKNSHPYCSNCQNLLVSFKTNNEPGWVRFVALFKTPEDTGVGDTVARYAAMLGGEKFKQWSKRIGLPCGCTQRQAEWNVKYSYNVQHDQKQSSDR